MQPSKEEYTLLKAIEDFFNELPKALVSPEQLTLLKTSANFFPPIIRFALEYRLNKNDQVDLQFCIRRDEDDIADIAKWFEDRLPQNTEANKLISFLKKWADERSSYYENISEIFLELDVVSTALNIPLLFFDLAPDSTVDQRQQFSSSILKDILGESLPFSPLLMKIIAACPEDSYVSNLGVLFSRDTNLLRVNIKRLSYHSVVDFLHVIGYDFVSQELKDYITFIYSYADKITLCLDIGATISPKIGFECFWIGQPSTEQYWAHFIEKLDLQTSLESEKITSILVWDQEIFPGAIKNWPEHLWAESLAKGENDFTYLKKWISHLKLSYQPDAIIELKSYLAYESLWMTQPLVRLKKADKIEHKICKINEIEKAIDNGVNYLLETQQQAGSWKDFYVEKGASDEWITAYVAYHLYNLKLERIKSSLDKAWDILKFRYRVDEGWGYNALTSADADSTIWVWLFANTQMASNSFPELDVEILDKYILENGGVRTYIPNTLLDNSPHHIGAHFNGWQIPHNCVTAVYALSGIQHAIDFLIAQQNETGYWYSYWWDGYEYATALSTEAMSKADKLRYEKTINSAVNWARVQARELLIKPGVSSFKLSLLLRILLCANLENKDVSLEQELVKVLVNSQEYLGSWEASALMKFPDPLDQNHQNNDAIPVFTDQMRNFTTVTVVDALNKYALSIVK